MPQTTAAKKTFTTKEIVLIAMMTAVMAGCSWISVPAEVPFTLQTFAVFCAVGILGGRNGLFSIIVYILLGAIGVPVFAGPAGGFHVITGKSGGYIVGFIFIALVYLAFEKVFGKHIVSGIIAMILGLLICYAFGTAWFIHVSTDAVTVKQAYKWCVAPFIIPDLLKLALSVVISERVKRYTKMNCSTN